MTTKINSLGPEVSRRTVLGGAGLAALALAGLSACGSGDTAGGVGTGAPSGATSTGPGGASTGSGGSATIKTADIPVGSGKIFPDTKTVVTQPSAGEFKAFSSTCTHAGCPVAEVLDTINCKCHGSKFSLTDGSPQTGPATKPLPAKTVSVSGDSLTVS